MDIRDSRDFAERLRAASRILAEAAAAADDGDMERAAALRRQADAAVRSNNRARRSPSTAGPSQRDLIVHALSELGLPTPTGLLAGFVRARFGEAVDSRQLASARRDESRAYSRAPSRRSAWVVPALEARRFTPMRAKLTLSSWTLERRVMGSLSERADQLRLVDTLAQRLAWLGGRDPAGATLLRTLVLRLASSVPGAVEHGMDMDSERISQAARAELTLIDADDRAERRAAAERAARQLDEHQQVWGADPPRAIRGGLT